MTSDKEKSFKAKLRNIANETNRNPADLWQAIVLERFLVRLGKTVHRTHFILKGGVLLAKYVSIGRETKDLDFLGVSISNNKQNLTKAFNEIASVDLNDGFRFFDIDIVDLIHPHMSYGGVRVSMIASFGEVRFPVVVDIGFGDKVFPVDKALTLTHGANGPLFEDKVSLLCYPSEYIFAEKLETIIYRGGANSRMKDFHDLYSMLNLAEFSTIGLKQVILSVFKHRKTPFALPIKFMESDLLFLQVHWSAYRRRLHQKHAAVLPLNIGECIDTLNGKLAYLIDPI